MVRKRNTGYVTQSMVIYVGSTIEKSGKLDIINI